MKHPFHSAMASKFEAFVLNRKASRRWSKVYDDNLHFFDNYCAKFFPGQENLSKAMLEWCKQRPTESCNSCRSRTNAVFLFIKYANSEGWTSILPPERPLYTPCTYIPHSFTAEELSNFFIECDKHVVNSRIRTNSNIYSCLNQLELPVYFRLLLSTGMRTNEARELKRKDVDLNNGIIEINKTKGFNQHRIALHESMLSVLRQYD